MNASCLIIFQHRILPTDPEVLKNWLAILKPGGIMTFTVTNNLWQNWRAHQDDLEKSMQWKELWTSKDMFHLPSCKDEDVSTRVRLFMYQKC